MTRRAPVATAIVPPDASARFKATIANYKRLCPRDWPESRLNEPAWLEAARLVEAER